MDSSFSVFFNLLYTYVIVIILKKKKKRFFLKKKKHTHKNPMLHFSLGPSQDSAFTFPNIFCIIASGDYILLIRIFFSFLHFCPTRSAQVIRDGRFKHCRHQWHHGYHRNKNLATIILGFFLYQPCCIAGVQIFHLRIKAQKLPVIT